MTVRVPSWRYLPVAFALVTPVLLCVGWTWLHAKNEQRGAAEAAAKIVRVQVDNMLSHAWTLLDRVAELTPKPCAEVLSALQRWSALNPYFRALVLANSDHIYCSSVIGSVDLAIGDFRKWPIDGGPDRWLFSVAGTPLAPDRPAILLGKAGAQRHEDAGVAADAREFLIELAFVMFEAKSVFLSEAELERFASDSCGVKGWSMAAGDWLAPLYAHGLLLLADGQVAFSFDFFRTYFLAQRFETSFDLMRYGPQRHDGSESSLGLDATSAAQPFLRALGLSDEQAEAALPEDCSRPG